MFLNGWYLGIAAVVVSVVFVYLIRGYVRSRDFKDATEYVEELISISPGYSAIRMRPKGESAFSQGTLYEQKMERKAPELPQVGDEIPIVALRGKGKHRLRIATVESVRPTRNSFILQWQDTNNHWHRRTMTPSMLIHRQVLTAW